MQRIYFLLPSIEETRRVVNELQLSHIKERHIHILARESSMLEDLPEARLAQSSDIIPAMERGLAAGGVCGAIAGLLAVTFPPTGLLFGGGALLGFTVFGAGFAAWMSGMVGADIPNSHIVQYEEAIKEGQVLVMVDVSPSQAEDVEAIIKKHHSPAQLNNAGPDTPAFS